MDHEDDPGSVFHQAQIYHDLSTFLFFIFHRMFIHADRSGQFFSQKAFMDAISFERGSVLIRKRNGTH